MLGLVGDIVPQVKLAGEKKVRFDTFVNMLHYRFTTSFLIVCCILVTANDYIGKPIECILKSSVGDAGQFGKAVNTYCWISSTFTLPSQREAGAVIGRSVAHPGVGPPKGDDDPRVYHAYYQWVPFVLFLQAVLFYLPHFIWRNLESSTLKKLLDGLVAKSLDIDAHIDEEDDDEDESPKKSPEEMTTAEKVMAQRVKELKEWREKMKKDSEGRASKIGSVAHYLAQSMHHHTMFYYLFVFCEVLNFVVVVGNIFFTDTFLGGEFSTYGTEVINFMGQEDEERTDPMTRVFPRVTKCDWHHYGPSGTIQKVDALCVLAVNIISEKIYVFLWFWFVILAVITGCRLLLRLVEYFVPGFRSYQLRRSLKDREESNWAHDVVHYAGMSDWFIGREIKKHMNPSLYPVFLEKYADELRQAKEDPDASGTKGHPNKYYYKDGKDESSEVPLTATGRSPWVGRIRQTAKKSLTFV